jgi:hypothetical protein
MNARIDGFTQSGEGARREGEGRLPGHAQSFVPVYEIETTRKLFSKTYQEVPAGFEIQKNIHVRFTDARILDRLVTAAAKEEIYDLVKVDFFVVDQERMLRHTANVRHQAPATETRQLRQSSGFKVEESHRTGAEKNGAYFPLDRYTAYQSAPKAA